MPIDVTCPCGHPYRVPDAGAGKRFTCKSCGRIVDVPGAPDLDIELLPEPPVRSVPKRPEHARPASNTTPPSRHVPVVLVLIVAGLIATLVTLALFVGMQLRAKSRVERVFDVIDRVLN